MRGTASARKLTPNQSIERMPSRLGRLVTAHVKRSWTTSMKRAHVLHITPGASDAGALRHSGLDLDEVLPFFDDLTIGPVPRLLDVRTWIQTRIQPWPNMPNFPTVYEAVRQNGAHFLRFSEVHLWYVKDNLREVLAVLWILNLPPESSPGLAAIRLREIASHPGERPVTSLAALTPDAYTCVGARPVNPAYLHEARRAWEAFTAPTPSQLNGLLEKDMRAFQSIAKVLHQYPSAETGLTHWEYELLARVTSHGPKAARIIGNTLADSDDSVGDLHLFHLLLKLADPGLPSPLLRLEGSDTGMAEARCLLTQSGEAVLAGEANRLDLNPVDIWAGGVHIHSPGHVYVKTGGRVERWAGEAAS